MTFDSNKKESRSFERLSVNLLSYNKLLAQCTSDIHCDGKTMCQRVKHKACLCVFQRVQPLLAAGNSCTNHRVVAFWRVMATFVVNVSKLPFTHLHITCPMPRKPIISTCAGTDARVSAKQTNLLCRARRRETKLTDEEPANRRTSECKRNLFVLPSEKEDNEVN